MRVIYKSYVFRDKDPMIYDVLDAIRKTGSSYKDVQENGGAKVGTLSNWSHGPTRRPQLTTVRASLRAVGLDLGVVDRLRPVNDYGSSAIASLFPRKKRKSKKAKRKG